MFDYQPRINRKSKSIVEQKAKKMMHNIVNQTQTQMQHMPTGDDDDDVPSAKSPSPIGAREAMQRADSSVLSPVKSTDNIPNEFNDLSGIYPNNQTKLESTKQTQNASFFNRSSVQVDKHTMLYDDAKHRLMRQEHIYSKCIDRECTFKPQLITK